MSTGTRADLRRRMATGLVALLLLGPIAAASATVSGDPERDLTTWAAGDAVGVDAADAERADLFRVGAGVPVVGPVVRLVDDMRREACGALSAAEGYRWPCADDRVVDHSDVCGDLPVVLPLWERTRVSEADPWSGWQMVEDLSCGQQAGPTPEMVLAEFRRLAITPSSLSVQPVGPVLVNIDTIAYVEPATQVLGTTVVGVPVTFTVTAAGYVWDFGEGEPFATTSPGHTWPDQDVAHAYARPGTGQIQVTTTWHATYTLGTDPTVRTVPGAAATTTTSAPFDILEAHTHLVANP